ncbi:MAG: GNAT family N-acetyltransferase [Lachnospiraceae bacterium]|nr:GNAT family N-acetyltransferase [Lachnospiraceae bacterium]
MGIRKAEASDASRIAEMMVENYRKNFFPIFGGEEFYFKILNVMDVAREYLEDSYVLENTYVYDDGVVKGMMRLADEEIVKLYVDPYFQCGKIGTQLLDFAIKEKGATWLWVLRENTLAQNFYKKNSFELTGEELEENDWITLLKMEIV